MNIDETIRSHQELRVLLSRYIAKLGGSMGLFSIGRDHNCPFGEWLHKHRTVHGVADLPEFSAVTVAHQQFHLAAYEVLKLALGNHEVEAIALLNGAYNDAEAKLIEALRALGSTQQD